MLSALAVSGYRSLRDLVIPLDRLNLVTGPNGSGKSNLYRALRLLAEIAQGRIIPSLARKAACSRRCGPALNRSPGRSCAAIIRSKARRGPSRSACD
jgi:energy-coupling factor transporter ATP-binding protein EcfA2